MHFSAGQLCTAIVHCCTDVLGQCHSQPGLVQSRLIASLTVHFCAACAQVLVLVKHEIASLRGPVRRLCFAGPVQSQPAWLCAELGGWL